MKKYLIIGLLTLVSCNPYKNINERSVFLATIMLDHSVNYVDNEVNNGNIEVFTGMSLLEDFLIIKNHLVKNLKKQKMAKIMVNQLAHVKIQGATGEYKHILLEAEITTEIRGLLDQNGYEDFKIIDWELVTVDGILIKEK
jgi:hypothetical protein